MEEKDINDEPNSLNNNNDINTSSTPFGYSNSSDNFNEQVNQVEVLLQDLKAEIISASTILSSSNIILNEKDRINLVKFTLKVKAEYNYTWEVYRQYAEVKNIFTEILSELSKKNIIPSENKGEIFTNVLEWNEDSIELHIFDIENYFKYYFKISKYMIL